MIDRLTLRESAIRCNVCLKTSFFMRIRICECIKGYLDPFRVGSDCSAEIDEVYLRESFKGNHTKSTGFTMPREPRRRPGGKVGGEDLICILSGINDRGAIFLEVAKVGHFSGKDAKRMLHDKIAKGAIISTDKHHAYRKALEEIGVAIHNHYSASDRSQGVINAINSLHTRFRDFLRGFKGISSRWVKHYLTWFRWLESFRMRSNKECTEKAVAHIANGFYVTRVKDCWIRPYCFESYAEATS
jgi:transposase-like protein